MNSTPLDKVMQRLYRQYRQLTSTPLEYDAWRQWYLSKFYR